MKIKFIGTSSGKAEKGRFHSSFILFYKEKTVLIDAGDGISLALLNADISFTEITDVVITHFHPDHISGIASFINQQKMLNRTNELKVHIPRGFSEAFNNLLRYNYIFSESFEFKLNLIEYAEDKKILGFILPRKNKHVKNKYGVNYFTDEYFSSYSLLLTADEKIIHYSSDIDDANDLKLFNDYNPVVLITEFTHLGSETLEQFISKSDFEKVIVTHYSSDSKEEIEYLKNKFENFYIAKENLEILF